MGLINLMSPFSTYSVTMYSLISSRCLISPRNTQAKLNSSKRYSFLISSLFLLSSFIHPHPSDCRSVQIYTLKNKNSKLTLNAYQHHVPSGYVPYVLSFLLLLLNMSFTIFHPSPKKKEEKEYP